tara:strand:+ start:441 stop:2735 length:2295 start_codon:yes stop_codon:yes gene_type:complete
MYYLAFNNMVKIILMSLLLFLLILKNKKVLKKSSLLSNMIKLTLILLSLTTAYTFFTNQKVLKKSSCILNMSSNILFKNEELPKFSKFENSQVKPGITLILENLEKDFQNLENKIESEFNVNRLYNLVVEELERIEYPLSFAWGLISHLHSVKNNDELRSEYDLMQSEVIKTSNKFSQSKVIYKALEKLSKSGTLNQTQKRIVDSSLHSMFLSGIGLNDEKREEFNKIKLRLAELSTKFSNNVLDSTKEFKLYIENDNNMKKLPTSALELLSQKAKDKFPDSTPENGPWKVTLDIPSYLPMMLHYPDSSFREKLYKNYIKIASEGKHNNIPVIKEILKLKKELAELLGFKSYAELSLSKKMATDINQIEDLLNMLSEKAKPYAKKDYNNILNFASLKDSCIDRLYLWDLPYWSERYKEKELNFKEEDLKPYFPLESVLEGLFKIAKNLFNIEIQEINVNERQIDVWDEDVKYFKINDIKENKEIATFFLDPYSRPGEKRSGAWMDSCVDKNSYLNKNPVAYLVCNGSPPIKNNDGSIKPSLMTFREVETLFHEFGHGLQHMLTTIGDAGASGINNIEWDAVELPSQFMENWCYHKPTIMSFAKHYLTKEKLPDELFDKLIEQKTFMTGGQICRQVYFSMLDLQLYSKVDEKEDILSLQKKIANEYLIMPLLDQDRFICSFNHIFAGGYSAGYYSYKWAEIMSADAFSAFEEIDLNDSNEVSKIGKRFRDTILSKGGSEHPAEVFKKFRGREPEPDALLRHSGIN